MSSDQIRKIRERMQEHDGVPMTPDEINRQTTMAEFDLGFAVPDSDRLTEQMVDTTMHVDDQSTFFKNQIDGLIRRLLARATSVQSELRIKVMEMIRECLRGPVGMRMDCLRQIETFIARKMAESLNAAPPDVSRMFEELVGNGLLTGGVPVDSMLDRVGTPRDFLGEPGVVENGFMDFDVPNATPVPSPINSNPFPPIDANGCSPDFVLGSEHFSSELLAEAPELANVCVSVTANAAVCVGGGWAGTVLFHQPNVFPLRFGTIRGACLSPGPGPRPVPDPGPGPEPGPEPPPPEPPPPEECEPCPDPEECEPPPDTCYYLDCDAEQILCLEEGKCPPEGAVSLGKECPDLDTLIEWMERCGIIKDDDVKLCVDCKTGEVVIRREEDKDEDTVTEDTDGILPPGPVEEDEESERYICFANDAASVEQIQRIIREKCDREETEEEPPPGGGGNTGFPPGCDLPTAPLIPNLGEVSDDFCKLLGIPEEGRGVLASFVCELVNGAIGSVDAISQLAGCDDVRLPALRGEKLILGIINQWLGNAYPDIETAVGNWINFTCPKDVPSIPEAMSLYFTQGVSESQARCWMRANGLDDKWFPAFKHDGRARPGVSELVQLRRRKEIGGRAFNALMRQLGWVNQGEIDQVWKLSEQIPPPSDLIRMMVRDVEDPKIVDKFKLDTDFKQKFRGQVEDWADSNGVTEEWMNRLWRAHWDIPAPGQLAEMFQRLRTEGGTSLSQFLASQGVNAAGLPPELASQPVGVSADDITTALQQQDILPFWVAKFMALSFTKLGRRDTFKLLKQGVITSGDAIQLFGKLGFSPRDAQALTAASVRERESAAFRHKAVREFATAELDEDGLRRKLATDHITGHLASRVVERAFLELREERRKKCVAAIRKRVLVGELNREEAIQALHQQDLSLSQANEVVTGFFCERDARGKHASVPMLCNWFRLGILDAPTFFQRLTTLGWDGDDAARIIRECEIRLEKEISLDAQKRLRECVRRKKISQRELEKKKRDLERRLKKRQSDLKTVTRTQKQRTATLGKINDRMADKLGLAESETKASTNAVFQILRDSGAWTQDEVLNLMLEASDDVAVDSFESLLGAAQTLLSLRIFPSPTIDEIPIEPPRTIPDQLGDEADCLAGV